MDKIRPLHCILHRRLATSLLSTGAIRQSTPLTRSLSLYSTRSLDKRNFSMTPKSDRSQEYSKVLRKDTINQAVVKAEYAVRGEIALRSEKLREELAEDDSAKDRLGFDKVISANIGNPQQLGQKGLTFLRQVSNGFRYISDECHRADLTLHRSPA